MPDARLAKVFELAIFPGSGEGDVAVSVPRDNGLRDLLELVHQRLAPLAADAGVLGARRHRRAVEEARDHIRLAVERVDAPELAAEEVRLATQALDRLIGRVGVDDVLGEIFAGFCLGK